MTRPAIIGIVALVGAAALALWLTARPPGESVFVDLIDALPAASQVRPTAESFTVAEATIGGVTKRAIIGHEPGRIVWPVQVPEDGWLKVSLGMLEPSWTVEGDGVLFLIGVSDGTNYFELLSLVMDPFANPGDRAWQDLLLDLSAHGGRTIDVIFNTRSSPLVRTPVDNRSGDMPAWGSPQLVVR